MSEDYDKKTLLELFFHLDKIHAGKENLFIPLSLAVFPVVLISWEKIDTKLVLLAACISIAIYGYHILVTSRFHKTQEKIFENIVKIQGGESDSQFNNIMKHENKGMNIFNLRIIFFVFIIFLWGIFVCASASNLNTHNKSLNQIGAKNAPPG